jgi:hypothetical protein
MTDLLFGKKSHRGGGTALTPWIAPLVCKCLLNPRASPFPQSHIVQILAVSKPGEDVILPEPGDTIPRERIRNVPHTLHISDGTTSIVAHLSPIARQELQKRTARDGGSLGPGTLLRMGSHRCVVVRREAPKVLPQPPTVVTVQHQLPVPPRHNALFDAYAALAPDRAIEAVFLDVYHDVVVLGQGPRLPATANVLDVLDVRRALHEADAAAARKAGTEVPARRPHDPTIGDVRALFSPTRGGGTEEERKQAEEERDAFWSFLSTAPPLRVSPSSVAEPASVAAPAPATNPPTTNDEIVVVEEEEEEEIIVVVDDEDEEEDMGIGNMLIAYEEEAEIPSATQEVNLEISHKEFKDAVDAHLSNTPMEPTATSPQESAAVGTDAPLPETQPLVAKGSSKSPRKLQSSARSSTQLNQMNPMDSMDQSFGTQPPVGATETSILGQSSSQHSMDAVDSKWSQESADPMVLATQPPVSATKRIMHPSQSTIDAVNDLIQGAEDAPVAAEPKKRSVERRAKPPGPRPKKMLRLGGDALRSLFM